MDIRRWNSNAFAATALLLSQVVAPSAGAELLSVCTFTTRCDLLFDVSHSQSCQDSDLVVSIRLEAGDYVLDTPGLEFPAELSVDEVNGARSFRTKMERSATHMLTIFADGIAFLSSHTQIASSGENGAERVNILAAGSTHIGTCTP